MDNQRPRRRRRAVGRWQTLVVAFALLLGLTTNQRALAQDESFLAFVESYYGSPQPQAAFDWLERIAPTMMDEMLITADPHGQRFALIAGFFAHILRSRPDLIGPLTDRLIARDQPNLSAVGALAIASSGVEAAGPALQRLRQSGTIPAETADALAATAPYPFPTLSVSGTVDLELMWLSFFATGNPLYIRRVAEAMAYADQGEAGAALAAFAYASLAERAVNHPAVLETLRTLAAQRSDVVGRSAAQLVASAAGRG